MIGVVIGLVAALAVTQVMVGSENQKRTTTSGSDAQVNGALALNTLQRSIQPAGYGFAASPTSLGCAVTTSAAISALVPNFPTTLAPVVITQGALGTPDTIRVLASGKTSYSVPLRIVPAGYNPANAAMKFQFPVASVAGVAGPNAGAGTPGDLMITMIDSTQPCEVFQVTANPSTVPPQVPRADTPGFWNAAGFPAGSYVDGAELMNMGTIVDKTYSIGTASLRVTSLQIAADSTPSYSAPTELFSNIVNLKAMYGKETTGAGLGMVDTWDNVTPTTNAGWKQVVAVRLAIVARSATYEKDEVTAANPTWDVGSTGVAALAGLATCPSGTSKCLNLKVDTPTDWKHYRYKVFDTVIPLRNMLWNS